MLEKDCLSDGSPENFSSSKDKEISNSAEIGSVGNEKYEHKKHKKGGFLRYQGRSRVRGGVAGYGVSEADNKTEEGKGVGQALKEARERLNLSLEEISAELKIRSGYLEAIEKEDFKNLPGGAYVFGFIRAYSTRLGLDGDDILQRFRKKINKSLPPGKVSFPPQGLDKGSWQKILFGGIIVILCIALCGWYWHQTREHSSLDGLNMPIPTVIRTVKEQQKLSLHLSPARVRIIPAKTRAAKDTTIMDKKINYYRRQKIYRSNQKNQQLVKI